MKKKISMAPQFCRLTTEKTLTGKNEAAFGTAAKRVFARRDAVKQHWV